MDVEFTVPNHAALIERILDGFIQAGAILVASGAVGKPSLDLVLQDDDVQRFQLPTESARVLTGDCEDLVIWWASWLRASGRDPNAGARIQAVGPKRVHCLLVVNGRIVDVYAQHLAAQERARQFQLAGFWSSLKSGISSVGRGISNAGRAVDSGVSAAVHGVGDAASAVGRGVRNAYYGVGDAALAVGRGVNAVGSGIGDAATAVYHGVGDAASAIGRVPGQLVRGAGELVRDVGSAAAGFVGDVAQGAGDLATAVIEAPTRAVLGVVGNVGRDIGEALGQGGGDQGQAPDQGQGAPVQYDDGGGYGYGGGDWTPGAERLAEQASYGAEYDRDPWDESDDDGWDA